MQKQLVFDAFIETGWTFEASRFIADNFHGSAHERDIIRFVSKVHGIPVKRIRRKPIPFEKRLFVFLRDNYRCVTCESDEDLTIDHIVAVSKGGSDDPTNLQTLCFSCNRRKAAK